MRRLTRRGRRDERGAVIVLTALCSVVILAVAALVIDVGAMLDERRQLQNAADAAALGVAQFIGQTCPTGPCVASTLRTAAQGLANANATDDVAAVDSVVTDFAKLRVTVKVSTKDPGGGTVLPYWFGQAVTGESGKTIKATAAASWSGLKKASVIPLTISRCEFDAATVNGTVYDVPRVVLFHTKAATCTKNGKDLPGGFGWLLDDNDSDSDDCSITPAVGNIVRDDTGVVGTPHSCDMATTLDKDVLVVLYDSLTGSGSNATYRMYGFGQFHVTGYRFTTSNSGGVVPCKSPNTCIGGYFVRFVGIGEYGGPNLGNRVALVS